MSRIILAAYTIAGIAPSWSPAPRPHTRPSATLPLYGSCFHSFGLPTPTVSTWASIAISFLPLPGLPTWARRFPILSVQILSKAFTAFISCLIRSMTGFSPPDSDGMAIMLRKNATIDFSYFLAWAR